MIYCTTNIHNSNAENKIEYKWKYQDKVTITKQKKHASSWSYLRNIVTLVSEENGLFLFSLVWVFLLKPGNPSRRQPAESQRRVDRNNITAVCCTHYLWITSLTRKPSVNCASEWQQIHKLGATPATWTVCVSRNTCYSLFTVSLSTVLAKLASGAVSLLADPLAYALTLANADASVMLFISFWITPS